MNQTYTIDRVEELNQRILGRNSGYGNQDVLLDVRSQATKYTFPLQAATPKSSQPILRNNIFNNEININQDTKYPWNGYVSNINNESILRNQVFALQRSPQSVYVPNSNSDLYISTIRAPTVDSYPEQLFPNLFKNIYPQTPKPTHTPPKPTPTSTQILFNNDTRQQLKDS